MEQKRVLVAYGIDVDAAANHLNTTTGPPANLTNVSRGIFGATRGVERLLELFARKSISASWFIPGHSIESFPTEMARIRDSPLKHEIGLHNYMHEYSDMLSADQFETVLTKSIEVANSFLSQGNGQKQVIGFTAPAWRNSPQSISLLEKHGLLYDHSFMHDDFQPYYAPYHNTSSGTTVNDEQFEEQIMTTNYKNDPSTWMKPIIRSEKPSSVVEIPANWTLDDWPPFQWNGGQANAHGYVDPHSVERQWREQFEWCYREYDCFVFPMTIHPQVSGRPHILLMHERLIDWINTHKGVEWHTFAEMAQEFKDGRFKEKRAQGWLT